MMQDKQQLSAAQIEAQVALELPERELPALVNVTHIPHLSSADQIISLTTSA